ncbi:MAG: c-type cytochrome [Planctomycetota bacterium]|nr:c-type cytochrome [Planctomycetota bacterium]MDA1211771.1 c-type cytochrome [Planctomycetota bacterium]
MKNVLLAGWLSIIGIMHSDILTAAPGPVPEWIWVKEHAAPGTAYFRREFFVGPQIESAEMSGLVDEAMTVYLDGKPIGEVKNDHRREWIDVTEMLDSGGHLLAVESTDHGGAAGIQIVLRVKYADGIAETLVTDHRWRASMRQEPNWQTPTFDDAQWHNAFSLGLQGIPPWGEPEGDFADYDQWRQALATQQADAGATLVHPNFTLERLYSSHDDLGSWISLEFDDKGRLLIGREGKGILRMTFPPSADDDFQEHAQVKVINDTLEECRGLLWRDGRLFTNANNSKGFYRLTDTDGDDRFDDVKLLRQTGGNVGHGRNAVVRGSDDAIYLVHGNDVFLPEDYNSDRSALFNFKVDRLMNCEWDKNLFNAGATIPGGHIVQTDADGKAWNLVAGGFRNTYGLDFNADGEMFTYDSDMEWDAGAPWYRPTRINHVVSGVDYGWRQGTGKFPSWQADSLPAILNIGKGSPTGVRFGTHSRFPDLYKKALYALDWAYGRIFVIHLTPVGSSYHGRAEILVEGRPLNVTDLDFGPDGDLYFVTGGRGTHSNLYRVQYNRSKIPPNFDAMRRIPIDHTSVEHAMHKDIEAATAHARQTRRILEGVHARVDPEAIERAWSFLGSDDAWLRHAARIAIERQPVGSWRAKAFAETDPTAAFTALLALCRSGNSRDRSAIVSRLKEFDIAALEPEVQLIALRAYSLCFSRMGDPDETEREHVLQKLEPLFPSPIPSVHRSLCELLVHLESPTVAEKATMTLNDYSSQEEKLMTLYLLRNHKIGWDDKTRRVYLTWLRHADGFQGGQTITSYVNYIREDVKSLMPPEERERWASWLEAPDNEVTEEETVQRPFVKDWTMKELSVNLSQKKSAVSFEKGKELFKVSLCIKCHRMKSEGTQIGPDLTDVGRRFNRLALLESIVLPSKVIDDKYQNRQIVTLDGKIIVGKVVGLSGTQLEIATNPLHPEVRVLVDEMNIEFQATSLTSPMPQGLLNTLSEVEIDNLLAFLESGGDENHPVYRN